MECRLGSELNFVTTGHKVPQNCQKSLEHPTTFSQLTTKCEVITKTFPSSYNVHDISLPGSSWYLVMKKHTKQNGR